jgi:hypothetical protein
MSAVFLEYSQANSSTSQEIIIFSPFIDSEGLPFPLYLHPILKILLSMSLLLALVQGTRLRAIIIAYIISPETKLGPINYLIWVDEMNGVFLGVSIAIRIIFILCPYPVNNLLGSGFCKFVEFIGILYIGGMSTWGCYIAVLRVLFIKAQMWLQDTIGVTLLLQMLLLLGLVMNLSAGLLFLHFDEDSITKKFCYHLSVSDFNILEEYQVGYCDKWYGKSCKTFFCATTTFYVIKT